MIAPALVLPLLLTAVPSYQDEPVIPPIQDIGDAYELNFAVAKKGTGDTGMTLARFVQACQNVTGIVFTYDTETGGYLENAEVLLVGTKQVPKAEFYNFFQILMVINDFVCTEIGPDPISIIEITSSRPDSATRFAPSRSMSSPISSTSTRTSPRR